MSEYMGSDNLVALQKSLRKRRIEFSENPLLSNGGRVMNILEPDRFGWDKVRDAAEQDGFVGLTRVDREQTLPHLAKMFGEEVALPYWQVFTGKPDDVNQSSTDVITGFSMPNGWTVKNDTLPDEETIHASQLLNNETGVAPAPAYFLRGEEIQSMLTCVYDDQGTMAACASGTMRYHPAGPQADWMFAGGVSVSPDHRRSGLGSYVNANLLIESQKVFNWVSVLEQAKEDNLASVGMITRCGLVPESGKITVIINLAGGEITR